VAVVVPVLTGSLLVAALATTVVGLMSGPSGVLLTALTQTATDDAFRGRVGSVSTLLNLGITPLAMAALGVAVDAFGLVPAFAVSGAIELGAALLCLTSAMRAARLVP
jgi:hypothetical protein